MMTAKDIREKRFEKAAWGYRPEDIDEFLGQLEATFQEIDNEREDSNHKIQLLADKVREYMKDEEAIKDALLGAQKEGHRIVSDANEKADQILEKAKEEAAALLDEATRQHDVAMEKNRAEIAREQEALVDARRQVAEFKRSLFDMYKGHLEMISAMPDVEEEVSAAVDDTAENEALVEKIAEEAEPETTETPDPFAVPGVSADITEGKSPFTDLQFGENNTQDTAQA